MKAMEEGDAVEGYVRETPRNPHFRAGSSTV